MNNADIRRKLQLDFLKSNEEIEVGSLAELPISLSELKTIDRHRL
jgi:hypothetical protein